MPPAGYGARIRALREEKGWDQAKLAAETAKDGKPKLDKETVVNAELERNPRMRTLERIAHALGLHNMAQLFATAELESSETQATMRATQEGDPLYSRRQKLIGIINNTEDEEELAEIARAIYEVQLRRLPRGEANRRGQQNE